MKRHMKKILIILFGLMLVGIVGLIALHRHTEKFYWELKSSQKSPSDGFGIYEYHYSSDSDRHAPYGVYLFLSETRELQKRKNGYLIFAGYCEKELSYNWVSNDEITVNCQSSEANSLRTLSEKAYGIQINIK